MSLLRKLIRNEGRVVTDEEFNYWKKKRTAFRARVYRAYREGLITPEFRDDVYEEVDKTTTSDIAFLEWNRPIKRKLTPLRIMLEHNEGRMVSDDAYEYWLKARKWRLCRVYNTMQKGEMSRAKGEDYIRRIDDSTTYNINKIKITTIEY